MSYIVSARAPSGEVRFRRDSMIAALDRGLALLSCGMEEVVITDPSGQRRSPAEFSRLLLERSSVSSAATLKTRLGFAA